VEFAKGLLASIGARRPRARATGFKPLLGRRPCRKARVTPFRSVWLAGAISAGAYTAGVLDFLFQALDEWEKAREKPGVPTHRVGLKVVAGASAGAISGALGVVALARGFKPSEFTQLEVRNSHRNGSDRYQVFRCVLPSLYDTWVTRPRLVAENGGIDFLSDEDLRDSKDPRGALVPSLLNAKLLDDIKNQALLPSSAAPEPTARPPYSYIAEPLHVYMTVSNLRGIPFKVGFGNSTYGMQTHGDRLHYTITGLGACNGRNSRWVATDTHLSLSVTTLPNGLTSAVPDDWDQYGTCALASSAFPIGLASRQITVPIGQYEHRQYPFPVATGVVIKPNFPLEWLSTVKNFEFLNVDGGLINNNPFDYAQYALMGNDTVEKTDGTTADSAVIMVAPFPEPPTFLPEGQPGPDLLNIVRALFPTLINQARFKATELGSALNSADYSRFLIAPQRKLPGKISEERYTIACGLLGGFGGFLDEGFRAHDFQLGRRNCQAFLRRTFGLPQQNPLGAAMKGQAQFHIPADATNHHPDKYTIIPLIGSSEYEVPLPHWPRMRQQDLDVIVRRITGRFKAVAPKLVKAQTASPLLRTLGRIGLLLGRKRVLEYVRLAILSDLIRRDQLEGWELPSELPLQNQELQSCKPKTQDDVRAVLAELASPAFSFRTVAGIARKTHLDGNFVAAVLTQFCQLEVSNPYSVWCAGKQGGEQLFTLTSRKPKGFWSLPVIDKIGNWLEPPAIDQNSAGRQLGA
jgi:Patatin-like phospholipase